MKKNTYFLAVFIVFLFLFPEKKVEKLRFSAVGSISSSWDYLHQKFSRECNDAKELELENKLLRDQLENLKTVLLSQCDFHFDPFLEKKEAYLFEFLFKRCKSIPARVVFRDPSNWSNSVWISVGDRENQILGKEVIQKDSPVVIGKAVVGIVEEVGKTRSRVRLITDPRFSLSVSVVRGGQQNLILSQKLVDLIRILSFREDLFGAKDIARVLQQYQESLPIEEINLELAKGELRGVSVPFWRSNNQKLKGTGFHHFEWSVVQQESSPIQNGDLLVTTGLDGIFPPNMHVGYVSKIFPMHEGDCMMSIEAIPVAQDLNYLTNVFVLPKNS